MTVKKRPERRPPKATLPRLVLFDEREDAVVYLGGDGTSGVVQGDCQMGVPMQLLAVGGLFPVVFYLAEKGRLCAVF